MKRSEKENPNVCATSVEKLSDVEEAELNKYILSAKERRFKTALWELINRDHLKVATAAPQQAKAPVYASQDARNSDKEKKRKRGQDDNRSNHGQALHNEAVEQDAKNKKVKPANDPEIINDAIENWTGEDIVEFTFNDEEDQF